MAKRDITEKLGIEERHFDEIKRVTNNLNSESGTLVAGLDRNDCAKYQMAAEKLGYNVKSNESFTCNGYPLAYDLEKKTSYKSKADN